MLEGGVEKGRVVIWRRRAILVGLPITRQDGWLVVMEPRDVVAQERLPVVPALCERKEPKYKKNIQIQSHYRLNALLSNIVH